MEEQDQNQEVEVDECQAVVEHVVEWDNHHAQVVAVDIAEVEEQDQEVESVFQLVNIATPSKDGIVVLDIVNRILPNLVPVEEDVRYHHKDGGLLQWLMVEEQDQCQEVEVVEEVVK